MDGGGAGSNLSILKKAKKNYMGRFIFFLGVGVPGIFFGCLRGRYKAPVPMANAYIFSQFEQKNSQSEGHFYVNQYSLQIAFIFNGLLIKIKHMIRNKSNSMQLKRPCLRKYYKNE